MIGGYYSSRGRRVTLCCLGERKEGEKEGGKTWRGHETRRERERGKKSESERERVTGRERVGLYPPPEGCIHPYPSRGGYWGFDYLF